MKIGIIAIHGGNIEPGTGEVARALVGGDFPVYINKEVPHITSSEFQNKKLDELLKKVDVVISIHGQHDTEEAFTMVGGLHKELVSKISESLLVAGFEVKNPPENLDGDNPKNVCNRGLSGKGVQLEISRLQRDQLLGKKDLMNNYIEAIKITLK
jgi:phage replication-related protein YjqB (UPF0714/DUF867 family)